MIPLILAGLGIIGFVLLVAWVIEPSSLSRWTEHKRK